MLCLYLSLLATSKFIASKLFNYALGLVNDPGNPRVKNSDPYPYPSKPVPVPYGYGFSRVGGKGMQKPGGQHNPWLGLVFEGYKTGLNQLRLRPVANQLELVLLVA